MKTLPKVIGTFVLVLFGTLASASAMAQHRGGGHGHGYGYGGGVRFGISLGFPIYASGYYPAPYYGYPAYGYPGYSYPAPAYNYPAGVMGSSSPPAYVEQGVAQAAPPQAQAQAQGDWYYCAASETYYPYVRECPSGWQRVPAQPSAR
jgi:hypothetical protein